MKYGEEGDKEKNLSGGERREKESEDNKTEEGNYVKDQCGGERRWKQKLSERVWREKEAKIRKRMRK